MFGYVRCNSRISPLKRHMNLRVWLSLAHRPLHLYVAKPKIKISKTKNQKNGKRFVDSLYSLIDLKTI